LLPWRRTPESFTKQRTPEGNYRCRSNAQRAQLVLDLDRRHPRRWRSGDAALEAVHVRHDDGDHRATRTNDLDRLGRQHKQRHQHDGGEYARRGQRTDGVGRRQRDIYRGRDRGLCSTAVSASPIRSARRSASATVTVAGHVVGDTLKLHARRIDRRQHRDQQQCQRPVGADLEWRHCNLGAVGRRPRLGHPIASPRPMAIRPWAAPGRPVPSTGS